MPNANGAQGYYFAIEPRLYESGWSGAMVSTFIALLKLASEVNNGTGILRYTLLDVAETIQKASFDGRKPRESDVQTAIDQIVSAGSIAVFPNRYLFIYDQWSYGHVPGNPKHRKSAERSLTGVPAEIAAAFRAHYGFPIGNGKRDGNRNPKRDGNGDGIPDGNANGKAFQHKQEQEQKQLSADPMGSAECDSPAAAEQPESIDPYAAVGKAFIEHQVRLGSAEPPLIVIPQGSNYRNATAMANSARLSGASPEELLATMAWAAGNPGERKRFAKPASFSNGAMWADWVTAYFNRPDQQPEAEPVKLGMRVNDGGYKLSEILGGVSR